MQPTRKADFEDFEEADFFDEGADADPSPPQQHASSSWLQQEELHASSSRPHADTGLSGSNRSANTTIMQDVILEDEPVEVFRAAAMPIAASLPMQHQTVRMGSSVPMNIPFLAGRAMKEEKEAQEDEVHYPGTFIPPHQLSLHDGGFMFSLTGASPSIAKKERLRARNAILMSTGFLENQASMPMQERMKIVAKPAGGLSQALQSS